MRQVSVALAFVAALAVSSAAVAQTKKIDTSDPNENTKRFLRDALPLMMPSAVMVMMLAKKEMDEKAARAAAPKKKMR